VERFLPDVRLGERPFELRLARRMKAGETETSWFERHGSEPRTDVPELVELRHFVDEAATDDAFRTVAARYTGDPNFDVESLVRELIDDHAVPYLPAQRYEDSGRRRRRTWEEAWRKQDIEDAIDSLVGNDGGDAVGPNYGEDAVAPEQGARRGRRSTGR